MKKRIGIILALSMSILISGCQGGKDDTEKKSHLQTADQSQRQMEPGFLTMMEDFETVYLPQDKMAAEYMKVLETMLAYIENKDEAGKSQAKMAVQEAYEKIEGTSIGEYETNEDRAGFMQERGISETEFSVLTGMGKSDKESYLSDLELYQDYLLDPTLEEQSIWEAFSMQIQYLYQIQEVKNQYMYYATNEFFAPCEENEIAYFQENVLAKLQAFAPQGVSWQEGEQDALQRQEECWTKIQSLLNEMTEKTGQITNGTSE